MPFCDGLDLLAARAVMRIGLNLESSDVVGVDCGDALRPIRGEIMKHQSKLAGLAVLLSVAAHPALAQDKLKIGVVVTLSGPAAALGQQVRDGFALAVKDLGGKMSGRDVDVVVVDDELKPDGAVTKVKGLLERDKVDFVVGPIFSNILQAIHKPVTDSKTFLISPNAGPSSYAGKNCSPFFYVTSYQNDQVHEILGKVAQDRGYKRVIPLPDLSSITKERSSKRPTCRWVRWTSRLNSPRWRRSSLMPCLPSCPAGWA